MGFGYFDVVAMNLTMRCGGIPSAVCVETIVGPLLHFSVEGWGRQQQHEVWDVSLM